MQSLWALAHGLESMSKRMLVTIGVTGPQRLVLRLIGFFGTPSPGDVADALHVHPSSLTGLLRRLEVARLVSRRQDPLDGRRAILTLTAQGKALNARRTGTVEAQVRRALGRVPLAKVQIAREVLSTVAAELGAAALAKRPVSSSPRLRGQDSRRRRRPR